MFVCFRKILFTLFENSVFVWYDYRPMIGLFDLWFYGPFNTLRSCRAWSVILSTLFLGRLLKRLTSTKCPYFLQ